MTIPQTLPEGTQVSCNVKGRVFRAVVVARTPTGVQIIPPANHTYHHVTSRQVTAIHKPGKWDPSRTQVRAA